MRCEPLGQVLAAAGVEDRSAAEPITITEARPAVTIFLTIGASLESIGKRGLSPATAGIYGDQFSSIERSVVTVRQFRAVAGTPRRRSARDASFEVPNPSGAWK